MKLGTLKEDYHKRTEKASDVARVTNYSLIAIVWVLCGQDINNVSSYKWVLIWLLLALVMDYFQYLVPGLIGTFTYRIGENKNIDKKSLDEVEVDGYPNCTPYITITLFILKFVFSITAVIWLLCRVIHN